MLTYSTGLDVSDLVNNLVKYSCNPSPAVLLTELLGQKACYEHMHDCVYCTCRVCFYSKHKLFPKHCIFFLQLGYVPF